MYGEDHESSGSSGTWTTGLTLLAASRKPFCLRSGDLRVSSASPADATPRAGWRRRPRSLAREGSLRRCPSPCASRAPMAEEAEWQERVNRHLGLREWEVRAVGATIGTASGHSTACSAPRRPLSAEHVPSDPASSRPRAAARCSAASAATSSSHLALAQPRGPARAAQASRRSRDARRLVYVASPAGGAATMAALGSTGLGTSVAAPRGGANRRRSWPPAHVAEQPRSWRRWVDWFVRRRALCAPLWSLSLLAADAGTSLRHPMLDPIFLAALASAGGHLGFGDRTSAMRAMFAERCRTLCCPGATKARYSEAFWGRRTREFAARWQGGGVDDELVDSGALKRSG